MIAPNDDCAAQIPVSVDGAGNITVACRWGALAVGANFPTDLINGGSVIGTGVPSGTTLSSGGSTTITLSNTLSAGSYTLEFVPAVVAATSTPYAEPQNAQSGRNANGSPETRGSGEQSPGSGSRGLVG